MVKRKDVPAPEEGFVVTQFLCVADVERAKRFYTEVLGGTAVYENGVTIIKIANTWIELNVGGGPTEDKPGVTLEPPRDPSRVSSFLNIRVADIHKTYEEWKARGAEFLTPPVDRGAEKRCYVRDPEGYLIEVGEATEFLDELD